MTKDLSSKKVRDLLFPPYALFTCPAKITKLPFGKPIPDN